jgi:uncharacterized protein YifN (PemK superfamily)
MALNIHPDIGTVVICDFSGFIAPEMVKRRPAIVISPRFRGRGDLCSVVPLSTTSPNPIMPYHCQINFNPPLPHPYTAPTMWAKCDMYCAVSFKRLFLPISGRDAQNKRIYDIRILNVPDLKMVRECVLHSMGLSGLTPHL